MVTDVGILGLDIDTRLLALIGSGFDVLVLGWDGVCSASFSRLKTFEACEEVIGFNLSVKLGFRRRCSEGGLEGLPSLLREEQLCAEGVRCGMVSLGAGAKGPLGTVKGMSRDC